jgi:hypothetical protein
MSGFTMSMPSSTGTGISPAFAIGVTWDGVQSTRTSWPITCSAHPMGTIEA